jgi:hypothetical protein
MSITAPTNVTAARLQPSPSSTYIRVQWDAAVPTGETIDAYVVEYQLADSSLTWDPTWIPFGAPAVALFRNVGTVPYGSYARFRVAAIGSVSGQGPWSTTSNHAPSGLPAESPIIGAATTTNGVMNISWTAPVETYSWPVTDYTVQYSIDNQATWVTYTDSVSPATSVSISDLPLGASYYFRVAAITGIGTGAYAFTLAPLVPMTAPTAPTSVVAVAGNAQASLSWTAPTSNGGTAITDYTIQYSSDGWATWTTFADGVSTGTTATVTGLTNGTDYSFSVAAINSVGTGTFSAQSNTVNPVTFPGAPTGVTGVRASSSVSLSWTAPAVTGGRAITDYLIEYSANGGTTWSAFSHVASAATSRVVTGLSNGTNYVFRVSAVTSFGTGAASTTSAAVKPCPDAAWLINYVRELTGVFSTDILSDTLLLFWLNEAYAELARSYQWPWLPISSLQINDSPAFDCDFFPLLSYRVAARVLDLEADDSPRGAAYTREYETMVSNLYKHSLRGQDVGAPTSMSSLVLFVRSLLDEYSQALDDSMIENKIRNVHDELVQSEAWVFPSSTFPYMTYADSRVLAYGAAGRLAVLTGKTKEFTDSLLEEYVTSVANLRLKYQNNFSTSVSTAESLARQARTFIGIYGKNVSDTLLKTWVYEEYQNLCSERSWAWLEQTDLIEIAAGEERFALNTQLFRVYELYLTTTRTTTGGADGVVDSEALQLVPSVLDVYENTDRMYYAIDHAAGEVVIAPIPKEDIRLRIRYAIVPQPGTAMPTTTEGTPGNIFTGFAVPERYRHLISYRVAMRAAVIAEAPQAVFDMCANAAAALYQAMYNDYEMAHTQEPFQLGGNGLESRKYVPWFRTA